DRDWSSDVCSSDLTPNVFDALSPETCTAWRAGSGRSTVCDLRHSEVDARYERATRRQSRTDKASNTFGVWNFRLTPSATHSWGGSLAMGRPLTKMSPLDRSRPSAMQRRSVVFPAPFGPTIPTTSPRRA